jgi:hypothetical protein
MDEAEAAEADSESLISCCYAGGNPLGITFEWFEDNQHLEISEIPLLVDGVVMKGDILVSVNGIAVEELSFDEIVSLLRSLESQERTLTFRRKILEEPSALPELEPELDDEADDAGDDGGDDLVTSSALSHSSVHQKLSQIFTPSSNSSPLSDFPSPQLNILHCNITNLSYWYRSRHDLTSRKQSAFVIQQNPQHMRFDSSLYVLKVDPNDGEIKPMKKFLSSHASRWAAYRHIETKMKERDGNPLSRGTSQQQAISTHFRIQIVSESFYHLDVYERLTLVYEHLLRHGYGKQYGPSSTCPPVSPSSSAHCSVKSFSYVGKHVQNLPLFTFLEVDKNPLHLLIETWTPSQWKPQLYPPPLSERYGKSHNEFRSQQVDLAVKSRAQKRRVKTLSSTTPSSSLSLTLPLPSSPSQHPSSPSSRTLQQSSAELLGLDSEILFKQFHKKTGGVYSHFFKDLSPGVKQMVLSRFLENKQLIQKEGARMKGKNKRRENMQLHRGQSIEGGTAGMKAAPVAPITTMSIMKAKLEASKHMADYDVGTENEIQMMEEYLLSCKKIEKYVMKIQRIYRHKLFRVIQRQYFCHQYSALTIQRIIRGRYARLYFRLLKKIIPIAVHRIIAVYRQYMTRKRMKVWYDLIRKATKVIAPILRRFVRKCINRWFKKYLTASRKIQSVIRMYLGKIHYYQLIGQKFLKEQCGVAVLKVQKLYRGYVTRQKMKIFLENYLIKMIDEPAVLSIQRIWRGKNGRKLFQQKKLENKSAIILQKYILRWHWQLYFVRLKEMMLYKYCAIQIQRVYRGRLDREIVSHLQKERWYERVYLPTVIKVQAVIRGHVIRGKTKKYRQQYNAACVIQATRRGQLARQIYQMKLHEKEIRRRGSYAVKIQTLIRSYLAKKKYKYLLYDLVGKRVVAAKIIIRAWKNFAHYRRYDVLISEHRMQLQQKKIVKLSKLRSEILKDLSEITDDISSAKVLESKCSERITTLSNFLIESEMRMRELETQLLAVTSEDIANGWGESYSLEFEMLLHQKRMAAEEMRLRKRELNRLQEELSDLYFEYEDTELELDHITSGEVEGYEYLRQNEVNLINKRVNRLREREVRIERCKWKVKSSRLKVIQRNRGYFQGIREKVKGTCLNTLLSLSVSLSLCLSLSPCLSPSVSLSITLSVTTSG